MTVLINRWSSSDDCPEIAVQKWPSSNGLPEMTVLTYIDGRPQMAVHMAMCRDGCPQRWLSIARGGSHASNNVLASNWRNVATSYATRLALPQIASSAQTILPK